MHSTLIVGRMDRSCREDVARLFSEFDTTEMPHLMGTKRRELFFYKGLYVHMQDFESVDGHQAIEETRAHPLFVRISENLRPHVQPYDPATWRSPADAMATRFYHWECDGGDRGESR